MCFINDILCPGTSQYHRRYELSDPVMGTRFSDHWTIHVIELPKLSTPSSGVRDDLERWPYFLKFDADRELDNIPTQLQTDCIRMATAGLTKLSHNPLERDQCSSPY